MDPELRPKVLQLCDICSRMNIAFGAAQQRAGAHGTSLGAYGLSVISPRLFCDLELPRVQDFCLEMSKLGLRTFVHSCGDETHLLGHLVRTGASCLELDPRTDPETCKRAIHGRVAVLGMLEPAHILGWGTVDQVRVHALEIMRILAPGGDFIMGPGCALPANTPRENIHTVMECARSAGVYAPDGSLPHLP
jgi:uroporphyrinogen decarboxylase